MTVSAPLSFRKLHRPLHNEDNGRKKKQGDGQPIGHGFEANAGGLRAQYNVLAVVLLEAADTQSTKVALVVWRSAKGHRVRNV